MTKGTVIWIGIAAAAIAGVAVLGPLRHKDESQPTAAVASRAEPATAIDSSPRNAPPEQVAASPASPDATAPTETVTAQSNDKTFRVNDAGRLVLDEQLDQYDNYQQAQRQLIRPASHRRPKRQRWQSSTACMRCARATSARSSPARCTARKKPYRDS